MIDAVAEAYRFHKLHPSDATLALASALIDLDQKLSVALIDVSVESEARDLRQEHYLAAIRAWASLHEYNLER